MKLAPLKDYPEPAYPTKELLVQDPELLRILPRRWSEGGGVLTRMAGFVGITAMAVLLLSQAHTVGAIATPPLFLTEDEARAVIEEEAKKAGLEFPEHGHALHGVDLPVTDPLAFLPSWLHKSTKIPGATRKPHKKDETELDGWNPKLHIGYKFVYRREFTDWVENYRNRDSSVTVYDAAGRGKITKAEYTKGTDTMAVFYDRLGGRPRNLNHPTASPHPAQSKKDSVANASENRTLTNPTPNPYRDYWEKRNADAAKRGNEELRRQVRDFIEWLKEEGVIQ